AFRLTERFDDRLLLYVAHTAMQYLDGIVLELEILLQLALQPVERFNALTEDHQAVVSVALLPAKVLAVQQAEKFPIFAEVGRGDVAQGVLKAVQRFNFSLLVGADTLALQLGNALFDRNLGGSR